VDNVKKRTKFERKPMNNTQLTTTIWTKTAYPTYDFKLNIQEGELAGVSPSWTVQLRRRGYGESYKVYYTPTGYRLRSEREVTKYLKILEKTQDYSKAEQGV
tara:strand:+ start:873 stop:1178 length:306 start_codon:yes stop_codon:yes gene_type:complete